MRWSGDWLYVVGTVFQIIAFTRGVNVTTAGIALAAYGIAVAIAHQTGFLK